MGRSLQQSWYTLNAQFRLTVHFRQVVLENRLRNEDRGEDVGDQTNRQSDGKAADRTGSKEEEEKGRDYGCHVGVDNGQEGFVKTGVHGGRRGLAVTQFLADAFE